MGKAKTPEASGALVTRTSGRNKVWPGSHFAFVPAIFVSEFIVIASELSHLYGVAKSAIASTSPEATIRSLDLTRSVEASITC